jgi:hypothetical protein
MKLPTWNDWKTDLADSLFATILWTAVAVASLNLLIFLLCVGLALAGYGVWCRLKSWLTHPPISGMYGLTQYPEEPRKIISKPSSTSSGAEHSNQGGTSNGRIESKT